MKGLDLVKQLKKLKLTKKNLTFFTLMETIVIWIIKLLNKLKFLNQLREKYKLFKENLEVTISFMEEKPVSVELPNNIECVIESTDAAIKNQTASSSYKPALLDCGLRIDVPPFIESGKDNTRYSTLEYVKE